ncbi:hypothetical protein ACFPTX_19105 [Pseudomonas sp. GCM10022188]|nr:hypothetical protein [Pseudomonas oryzagri]MCC6073884.1 hypothetical protein [Pseudomonas oryzagri]
MLLNDKVGMLSGIGPGGDIEPALFPVSDYASAINGAQLDTNGERMR